MLANKHSAVIMVKMSIKMNTRRPRPKRFNASWNELHLMRGKPPPCLVVSFGVLPLLSAAECAGLRRVDNIRLPVRETELLSIEPSTVSAVNRRP